MGNSYGLNAQGLVDEVTETPVAEIADGQARVCGFAWRLLEQLRSGDGISAATVFRVRFDGLPAARDPRAGIWQMCMLPSLPR